MVKTTELKEYKLDYNTFMGGWYISPNICEGLIDHYENNRDKSLLGHVGNDDKRVVNRKLKDSRDIEIHAENQHGIIGIYREELQKVLIKYLEKYPMANSVLRFSITENFNLQKYPKGGGFKAWHCENNGAEKIKSRNLVFMTYLNSVEKGGTDFYHQKITTPAEVGLTLIWPSYWTHVHRGQVCKTQEKYIITGWYDFV